MLLSIIIPTYNAEKYIYRCVESVIKQNCEDCEILVVDDGSTDRTLNIIHEIIKNNKKISLKYLKEENKGVSAARNKGIENAIGDYIFFLDADDRLVDNAIEQIKFLIKTKCFDLYIFSYFLLKNETRLNSDLCSIDDFSIYNRDSLLLFADLIVKTKGFFWDIHGEKSIKEKL